MTVAVKTGWPWAAFTMGVERGTLGGVHLPGVTVSSEEQWLPANAQGLSWGQRAMEGARLTGTLQ